MTHPITIPLINPNEPEALLAALHLAVGQHAAAGDLVCSLETTKSTAEVLAEVPGYLVGLRFQVGQTVRAGDILGYLAETPDWVPPVLAADLHPSSAEASPDSPIPEGLRITQPALALARQHHLDLDQLPLDVFLTEAAIQAMLAPQTGGSQPALSADFDPTAVVIYGGGGHGKSLLDLLRALGTYQVAGFIDDGILPGETVMGLPVLGGGALLPQLYASGTRLAVNAVGGIGDLRVRRLVFDRILASGFGCPAVTHPSAVLEPGVVLSPGAQVFPLAYVGSEVQVGFGTIINTGAIVSHECVLGDLVNISPGAILAGEVTVGDEALIGMGVTINLRVRVGRGARLGNGATVKADVPDGGLVPAGSVWPRG